MGPFSFVMITREGLSERQLRARAAVLRREVLNQEETRQELLGSLNRPEQEKHTVISTDTSLGYFTQRAGPALVDLEMRVRKTMLKELSCRWEELSSVVLPPRKVRKRRRG